MEAFFILIAKKLYLLKLIFGIHKCFSPSGDYIFSVFRINKAYYAAYFVPCWFLKTPANNNPPMIPIKIKATC